MTDNEIIKALKGCGRKHNEENDTYCEECQFKSYLSCVAFLCDRTIDLINRQKNKIERLKKEVEDKERAYNDEFCLRKEWQTKCREFLKEKQTTKSEAIKEFAEQLKENCYTYSDICGYQSTVVDVNQIDILVKEMTEVETNQRKEDERK